MFKRVSTAPPTAAAVDATTTPTPGGPPPAAASGSGLKSRATKGAEKLRHLMERTLNAPVLNAPLNVYSHQGADPTRPDVRGPKKNVQVPTHQPGLSRSQLNAIQSTHDGTIDRLFGGTSQAAGSGMSAARTDAARTETAIDAMFPAPAAPMHTSLGQHITRSLRKALGDDQRARDAALLASRALLAVVTTPEDAQQTWQDIVQDTSTYELSLQRQQRRNDVMRTLSSVDAAFDAVWALKQSQHHADAQGADAEPTQFAWQTCDKLLAEGFTPPAGSPRGLAEFIQHAKARTGRDGGTAVAAPLGTNETRDILACQALLHAEHLMKDKTGEADPQPRAAYLAWRNGYHESGPGTPFNTVVQRLHKFTTWVNRAVERPEFALGECLKSTWNWIKAAGAAKDLSPLTAMKFGLSGADLGLVSAARGRFEREMQGAFDIARAALRREANTLLEGGVTSPRLEECVLKEAILQHWENNLGLRKGLKLNAADRQAVLNLVAAGGSGVDPAGLAKHPALKETLRLATFTKWSAASLAGDADRMQALTARVDAARVHARSTVEKRSTRPDAGYLKNTAEKALTTTIGLTFKHRGQQGLDLSPGFALDTDAGSLTIAAGPQLKLGRAKSSSVRFGTNSSGSEVYMGREMRFGGQGGVVGRLGAGIGMAGAADASAGANANLQLLGVETAHEEGVSIRIPKGSPDQKGQAKQVLKFLFDVAAERRTGTAISPDQVWERFAREFIGSKDISVNYQVNHNDSVNTGAALSGAARLGAANIGLGPSASVGGQWSRTRSDRNDLHGRVPLHLVNKGTRSTLQLQAGLSGAVPTAAVRSNSLVEGIRFPNPGAGNYRLDFTLGGKQGQVRLAIEDGKINPRLTLQYSEFRSESAFLRRIESRRNDWQTAMADDPRGGKAALDDFVQQVKSLNIRGQSGGSRGYLDRSSIRPEVAEDINQLLGHVKLLQRNPPSAANDAALAALDGDIRALLKNPASWTPERLAVFEVESEAREVGVDLLLSLRSRMQAQPTLRYLVEMRLPGNAPTNGAAAGADGPEKMLHQPYRKALNAAPVPPEPVAVPVVASTSIDPAPHLEEFSNLDGIGDFVFDLANVMEKAAASID